MGITADEGIETRAQDHVLTHSAGHGLRELLFGDAASNDEVRSDRAAQPAAARVMRVGANLLLARRPDDPERVGILEDDRPVHQLMDGAADGDPLGRDAGLPFDQSTIACSTSAGST